MDLRKKGFHLPEKIYFEPESLTDFYGRLIAEPFERGFGTTVGNALRRCLLSSIEGTAVTGIRIPGVLHEFSTLPGVKEDMVDIILNIKQLRFKMYGDTSKVVTINAKGPANVKGEDIITTGDIMVLTPDQHIAKLDKDAELKMELILKKGRGYVPAEANREEDQPIDLIPIDSIFTPIRKVNFWVESARVGRSTNYDKLIMEVWTDGTTTPTQAVTYAAKVLNEHLLLFQLEELELETMRGRESVEVYGDPDDMAIVLNKNLLRDVSELELSVRATNCLKNANISTIAELVQKTENELLRTKNFGRKSLEEIKEVLATMGLRLNMRIDPEVLENLTRGGDSAS
ncbi:MAG: DNA-directed RNA polymerase subunit alpha [Thermodesulfovibrionia bacterium]